MCGAEARSVAQGKVIFSYFRPFCCSNLHRITSLTLVPPRPPSAPPPRSRPPHTARSSLAMAIEAFLGTTAQRAYLGTSTYHPVLLTITDTYRKNSCYSLVFASNHPSPATNTPLTHFRRSHRRPNPRRIGVQLGTIELSPGPPSPPHRFPLITGRCMGGLRCNSLQGSPNLIYPYPTLSYFQLRPYHATSPSSRLESKFSLLLAALTNPLHTPKTGFSKF